MARFQTSSTLYLDDDSFEVEVHTFTGDFAGQHCLKVTGGMQQVGFTGTVEELRELVDRLSVKVLGLERKAAA